jgi:hypothetical protein
VKEVGEMKHSNDYHMDPYSQQHQGMSKQDLYQMCEKYMNYYAQLEKEDGTVVEGIVDRVDKDHVDMLVPVGDQEWDEQYDRQYGYGGYGGYGGYPYGYGGYGYGIPRRFRRFRRIRYPFFILRRLFFPYYY